VENSVTYKQTYDSENRLASVKQLHTGSACGDASPTLDAQWDFAYDGDGTRVSQLYTPYVNGTPGTAVLTAYFIPFQGTLGGAYEVSGSAVKKYYSIAGMTVATLAPRSGREPVGARRPALQVQV
jgi:hypothetical protein